MDTFSYNSILVLKTSPYSRDSASVSVNVKQRQC